MVQQLGKEPSTRLLKHVVRCYLRLSDNLRCVHCMLIEVMQTKTYTLLFASFSGQGKL